MLYIKSILIIICTCSIGILLSQDIKISLEEAIRIAEKNNAGLLRDQWKVEQQKILAHSGISNEATSISVSAEEFGSEAYPGIYSFNVQQNFNLPKANAIQKAYYKSGQLLAEKNLVITNRLLSREVSKAYYTLQYAHQQMKLLKENKDLTQNFLGITELQFEMGETGKIPVIMAKTSLEEVRLTEINGQNDLIHAQNLLNSWLRDDDRYDVNSDMVLNEDLIIDSIYSDNPHILLLTARKEMANAGIEKVEAQLLPKINSAFKLQTDTNVFPLFGLQLGVNMPLFNKNTKKHIDAARLELKIQEEENKEHEMALYRNIERITSMLQKNRNLLQHFREYISPLLEEHRNSSLQAYREGEISFHEYLEAMQQSMRMKFQHLEAQYNYIILMSDLEYWLNN